MKPTPSALALSITLGVALAGCDKHQQRQAPPAATVVRPNDATKVATAPTAPAAAPATEGMTCGDAEMKDGTCGGEGGCAKWDEAAAEVAKRGTPTDAVWATIPVQGMTCGGCERRIIADLGKVDGVLGVEADSELGQVRVAFHKGDDRIATSARDRITALGYHPK